MNWETLWTLLVVNGVVSLNYALDSIHITFVTNSQMDWLTLTKSDLFKVLINAT